MYNTIINRCQFGRRRALLTEVNCLRGGRQYKGLINREDMRKLVESLASLKPYENTKSNIYVREEVSEGGIGAPVSQNKETNSKHIGNLGATGPWASL